MMKRFIQESMNHILKEFKKELAQMVDGYCILKQLRFDNITLPDYRCLPVQQLYLLRFFPAYVAEYYMMYKSILDIKKSLLKSISVLSFGSGGGLDFYGLFFAYKELGGDIDNLHWEGVDLVKWMYRDLVALENVEYIPCDINDMDKLKYRDYDVITFPKSIGEFSPKVFNTLKDVFRDSEFSETDLFIANSIRNSKSFSDRKRANEIQLLFEHEHKYELNEEGCVEFHVEEDIYIDKVCPGFTFPLKIRNFITNLSAECPTYKKNGRSCDCNCAQLDRWPILKARHLCYEIKHLSR